MAKKLWNTQKQTSQNLSVILMHIEMPLMDGLTCAQRIRELQQSGEIIGHIPILAVSVNARSEQVRQGLDVGMDDAIAKPFRIPELLPKLELLARKD
jgi:CheY-like chemotaxis protein